MENTDGNIKKEFENRLMELERGKKFWKYAVDSLGITKNDLILVLSKYSKYINMLALQFLSAVKGHYGLDRIFIFGTRDSDYQAALSYSSAEAFFYHMDSEEAEGLRLLNCLYRFSDRIIYCNPNEISDKNIFGLLRLRKMHIEDILAVGVFGLKSVPDMGGSSDRKNIKVVSLEAGYRGNLKNIFHRKTMLERLQILLDEGKISEKSKIVIFGLNEYTGVITEYLSAYQVYAVIDNDITKTGKTIHGVPIRLPADILIPYDEACRIIIASGHFKEMAGQLESMGYVLGKNIFIIEERKNQYDDKLERLGLKTEECRRGYQIYCELIKEFPDTYFFYNQRATGNTFLLGMHLPDYLKKKHIEKYLVLNVTRGSCRICQLFGLSSIYCGNKEKLDSLWAFARLMEKDKIRFREMCPYESKTNLIKMRAYKGLDFGSIYRNVLYESQWNKKAYVVPQKNTDYLFDKYGLKRGHTVVLSPFANTLKDMDKQFWIKLAEIFKKHGYDVCTNCGAHEQEIEGTEAVHAAYDEVIDFVDRAGYFVGIRSGLCDILSSTTGKMAIIYPGNGKESGEFLYNYFSIAKIYSRMENLLEIFQMPDGTFEDKAYWFFKMLEERWEQYQ